LKGGKEMGEAKRRGTFEQRKKIAQEKKELKTNKNSQDKDLRIANKKLRLGEVFILGKME